MLLKTPKSRLLRGLAPLAATVFLTGCAATSARLTDEAWLAEPGDPRPETRAEEPASAGEGEAASTQPEPEIDRRVIPTLRNGSTGVVGPGEDQPALTGGAVNVTLPPQPVSAFVNTVFGEILEQPFTLGPGVAERDELISLRSVQDMPRSTFLSLVEEALKDYGLAVFYENGLFRILEREELRSQMPRFITSRARRDVPAGLRPVVQFVELTAIDAADMEALLAPAFPETDELTIRTNRRSNSLVISGLADNVNLAVSIVEEMDELRYAGTQVITFSPLNWRADELARTVSDVLTLEGFFVGVGAATPRALTLLPLEFTNQVMIFASDRSHANYALGVARRLDAEAFQGEVQSAHVYQVMHADAADLVEIVGQVIGASPTGDGAPQPQLQQGGEAGPQRRSYEGLTVDEQGNRIIFYGTRADYREVASLLDQLDTPVAEVMIEVAIAEVTLTDDASYGLDLVFDSDAVPGFRAQLNSEEGFSGVVRTGEVDINASAEASNNQINVLSVPRVVTRSGQDASIQVGTDVPLITSQRAGDTQQAGSTDFFQTVSYRSTGILLSVEPRVFSGDRIDLTIQQEVSSAENNPNSSIASPVISNRSLTSQLTLQDGQTAVLGGLIDNRLTRGNSGIPFLKDVPVVGSAFRSETLSSTRTMLLVLVTPYILNTRDDRQAFVDALTGSMNRAYNNQVTARGTLRGPSEPMQLRAAPSMRTTADIDS